MDPEAMAIQRAVIGVLNADVVGAARKEKGQSQSAAHGSGPL